MGVFPLPQHRGLSAGSLPHARGGVSGVAIPVFSRRWSSPRPWGCFWSARVWVVGLLVLEINGQRKTRLSGVYLYYMILTIAAKSATAPKIDAMHHFMISALASAKSFLDSASPAWKSPFVTNCAA